MWGDVLLDAYGTVKVAIPPKYQLIISLLFFTVVIAVYGIFVYYFYKFLSQKNIINLNLKKFNTSEHPAASKSMAVLFYIIEYIIILPILTFIWFSVLAIFLLVLARTSEVATILTIAAALVAAVRLTSYVSQNLSQDLAKMLPLTLLALALVEPGFFSVKLLIERVIQIPSLMKNIPYYLIFIFSIELVMRAINSAARLFNSRPDSAAGEMPEDTNLK